MRKYLQQIVPSFLAGSEFEQSATCSVRHCVFYSYATPVAVRAFDADNRVVIYITEEKFSKTTSHQCNSIRQLARSWRLVEQSVIERMAKEVLVKSLA
jgi:hypothetical protein